MYAFPGAEEILRDERLDTDRLKEFYKSWADQKWVDEKAMWKPHVGEQYISTSKGLVTESHPSRRTVSALEDLKAMLQLICDTKYCIRNRVFVWVMNETLPHPRISARDFYGQLLNPRVMERIGRVRCLLAAGRGKLSVLFQRGEYANDTATVVRNLRDYVANERSTHHNARVIAYLWPWAGKVAASEELNAIDGVQRAFENNCRLSEAQTMLFADMPNRLANLIREYDEVLPARGAFHNPGPLDTEKQCWTYLLRCYNVMKLNRDLSQWKDAIRSPHLEKIAEVSPTALAKFVVYCLRGRPAFDVDVGPWLLALPLLLKDAGARSHLRKKFSCVRIPLDHELINFPAYLSATMESRALLLKYDLAEKGAKKADEKEPVVEAKKPMRVLPDWKLYEDSEVKVSSGGAAATQEPVLPVKAKSSAKKRTAGAKRKADADAPIPGENDPPVVLTMKAAKKRDAAEAAAANKKHDEPPAVPVRAAKEAKLKVEATPTRSSARAPKRRKFFVSYEH